ncbi:MAG TPA: adaptor protein MecA [Chondromyces sp.]|nr:adaptor protein MecA [Chondromyces sp.]
MKIERLSENKIKLTMTVEELHAKGLFNQQLLEDSIAWHDFFDEVLEAAEEKYGIQAAGSITIEIHAMTEKELILVLSFGSDDVIDDSGNEGLFVNTGSGIEEIYLFEDIEHVICLIFDCKKVRKIKSSLYFFDGRYYLYLHFKNYEEKALLEPSILEYAEFSKLTKEFLYEYGKVIIKEYATSRLFTHFDQ